MKRFFYLIMASLIISSAMPAAASADTLTSLISSAKTYIGTPYRYGGTTTSGFDCSAYVQRVFKDNGISIPRATTSQYTTGTAVSKSNLETGDLVFFNTNGKSVSHVGIYIGANNFIHTSTSRGVMISSINDPHYWGSRYIGARRVANFTPASSDVAAVVETPKAIVIPNPTRAEIADTLVKELNLPVSNDTVAFNDVSKTHPQIAAITAVAEAGIFTGSNGFFKPDGNLTRAQLAKVLVEAFGLEGRSEITFKDVPQDHWAKEYIEILYQNKITTGYEDGNYGVDEQVTMNQFKTFIERISK